MTRRDLIDKLSDTMDADNAAVFVDDVLRVAFEAGFRWCANGTDNHGEYNGGSIEDGFTEWRVRAGALPDPPDPPEVGP